MPLNSMQIRKSSRECVDLVVVSLLQSISLPIGYSAIIVIAFAGLLTCLKMKYERIWPQQPHHHVSLIESLQ